MGALRISVTTAVLALMQAGVEAQAPVSVFCGNLHSHTSFSNGAGLSKDAFAHARTGGLGFQGQLVREEWAVSLRDSARPLHPGCRAASLFELTIHHDSHR